MFFNGSSSQANILNNIENLFPPFNIRNLYIYIDNCIDFNPICREVSLTPFKRVQTQKETRLSPGPFVFKFVFNARYHATTKALNMS